MAELLSNADPRDLEALADEQLVVLARGGLRAAEHTLVLGYREGITRQVRRFARRQGLGPEDTDDACQEALAFWFPQAIRAYDSARYGSPRGCRFGTLQYRVLAARCQNFGRALRRQGAHTPQGLSLEGLATQGLLPLAARPALATANPDTAAADRARADQVHAVLVELPEPARALWAWRAAGGSLRGWAQRHQRAYKQVRRCWADLRGLLTAHCLAR